MAYTPDYTKAQQAKRAELSLDERKVAALEQIADELHGIHGEMITKRASTPRPSTYGAGR